MIAKTTTCPECGALADVTGKPNPEQPDAPIACKCRFCGAKFNAVKDGLDLVFADLVKSPEAETQQAIDAQDIAEVLGHGKRNYSCPDE